MAGNGIHTRGLTSFFTLFGFIIMSITGLMLYVVPVGRVAYWTDWGMLGLSKTEWGNIHILSSILFIVAGAFHTYFNWKPLMNYFKDRARQGVKLRKELAISSIISVWIVVSAIWPFPPLSYLLEFNLWLKDTWIVEDSYEPPFGHAELLSLKTFTQKMQISLADAVQELHAQGIEFASTDQTVEEIAIQNNLAPMQLYALIKKFEPAPEPETLQGYTPEQIELEFAGTGIGNKSITAMSERVGLDTTVVLQRLMSAGLTVSSDQTMKAIAGEANTQPIEILKTILIEGYVPEQAD